MRKAADENRGIKCPMTHVYTGDGKGKTTAALGLGLRASGYGQRVYMIQFLKNRKSGEGDALLALTHFQLFRFQTGEKGFFWEMDAVQKKELLHETLKAFAFAEFLMREQLCDMLILDEIFGCIQNGLLPLERLINLIRHKTAELVLTGRNAPEEVIQLADYVSEIKAVKHPYQKDMPPRRGIEY